MAKTSFPAGWDEERVQRVLEHYETQSEGEALAEDELPRETLMQVPNDLVPAVDELIAKRRRSAQGRR